MLLHPRDGKRPAPTGQASYLASHLAAAAAAAAAMVLLLVGQSAMAMAMAGMGVVQAPVRGGRPWGCPGPSTCQTVLLGWQEQHRPPRASHPESTHYLMPGHSGSNAHEAPSLSSSSSRGQRDGAKHRRAARQVDQQRHQTRQQQSTCGGRRSRKTHGGRRGMT